MFEKMFLSTKAARVCGPRKDRRQKVFH